jgi:hypothetical protein
MRGYYFPIGNGITKSINQTIDERKIDYLVR